MAAGSFSLTIAIPITGGSSNPDQVDRALVKAMLQQAETAIGGGVLTSGNLVYQPGGSNTAQVQPTTIGSWTYAVGT